MIGIINCELSNIASVENMIKKVGGNSVSLKNPNQFSNNIDKLILPGVGSFDIGIEKLTNRGWSNFICDFLKDKNNTLLGICLGMQLLFSKSEEGNLKGLNLINGNIKKFKSSDHDNKFKIPHMGWNIVNPIRENQLIKSENKELRFYFVHSYYASCFDEKDIIATTSYGNKFTCAVKKNNIYGVQFHPEKSHSFGMNLMKSFIRI